MRVRRVLGILDEKSAGALADPLDEPLVAGALDAAPRCGRADCRCRCRPRVRAARPICKSRRWTGRCRRRPVLGVAFSKTSRSSSWDCMAGKWSSGGRLASGKRFQTSVEIVNAPGGGMVFDGACNMKPEENQVALSGLRCGRAWVLTRSATISEEMMSGLMMIYAICLVVGLMFTLVSAVFGHFFGGHGDAMSAAAATRRPASDSSGVPGISILQSHVIAAFHHGVRRVRPDLLANFPRPAASGSARRCPFFGAIGDGGRGVVVVQRRVSATRKVPANRTWRNWSAQTASHHHADPGKRRGRNRLCRRPARVTRRRRVRKTARRSPTARRSKSRASSARNFTSNRQIEYSDIHQPSTNHHSI